MSPSHYLTLAACAACALTLAACESESAPVCNDIAGRQGLFVTVPELPTGAYLLTFDSAPLQGECTLYYPHDPEQNLDTCTGRGRAHVAGSAGGRKVLDMLGETDNRGEAEMPAQIRFVLKERETDEVVLEHVLTPTYEVTTPGGEGCPVYRYAEERLDLVCSEAGIERSLLLVFEGTQEPLRVQVEADTLEAECRLLDANVQAASACEISRGAAPVQAEADRAALRIDAGSGELPASVHVRVYDAEDRLRLEETRSPDYDERYPNGRFCDPLPSKTATVTFTVPSAE